MSTTHNSPVAVQSKQADKSILIVGGIAAAAVAAALTFAPMTKALGFENLNLSTGVSSQDGSDEWSSLGVRATTQDGLENLGVGVNGQNVDGDESQAAGLGIQTTDNLDNAAINTGAATQDGDEWNKAGLGLGYQDGLENFWTDVNASSVDGDERTDFGIKFSFED